MNGGKLMGMRATCNAFCLISAIFAGNAWAVPLIVMNAVCLVRLVNSEIKYRERMRRWLAIEATRLALARIVGRNAEASA